MLSHTEMLAKYPKIAAICTTDGEEFATDVWWHENHNADEVERMLKSLDEETFGMVRADLQAEEESAFITDMVIIGGGPSDFDAGLVEVVCRSMAGG